MAEWEVTKEEEIEEGKEVYFMEEQEEEADEGELLVLWRTLSGIKAAKDEQRENIFHTRCMV